ncbi:MAG: Uma2 family endonuclease [Lachnospiraceae bacterium]|nr:Uma2 family endonuclease [Lachnospiraceae bacterium]
MMSGIMEKERDYTPEDVYLMKGHVELIDGNLLITDSTSPMHNFVTSEIADSLRAYIKSNRGSCKVMQENVALWCNEIADGCSKDFYQPDIMLVCDTSKIDEKGVHGTPDFIAEVTSPATRAFDYGEKKEAYRRMGVREYWIIDLKNMIAVKHLLENNYDPEFYISPTQIDVSIYENLSINLSEYLSKQ